MPTAFVTGANRGIGLELCRQLKERGFEVIGTARRDAPELEALGVRVERLDVADPASVGALAGRLSDVTIDVLINNAGILERTPLEDLDLDAIRRQLEVNAVGPVQVTAGLLPRLADGAKVAFITSRMGSIADNTSGGAYGYRMSKAALNAAAVSFAHDLKDRGIAVVILHPGFVKTDMTGGRGDVTADVSAGRLLDRIDALSIDSTGQFLHAKGDVLPW
jgi:NAD(P)-dependent dehydrogenase (short-subunit alcohol dehydrogenase family)